MSIAVLFSLFQATEPMAKTLIDMWLELFILSIVISVAQAIIVGFVVAAASSMNPSLAWGSSIIGSLVMGTLVLRAFGAIWGALGRFTGALGAVTGGRIAHVGEIGLDAGKLAAGAAIGIGTAGLGAGITALAGGSAMQIAGSALSGSDRLFSAAALGSMALPESSALKGAATDFYEGAMGQRLLGPMGGLMLAQPSSPSLPSSSGETSALREALSSAIQVAVTVAPPEGYGDSQAAASAIRDALGSNQAALHYFDQHQDAIVNNVVGQTNPTPATPPPSGGSSASA
jgi:hypothetical protein